MLRHMEDREVTWDSQHSFTKGMSHLSNLVAFSDGVTPPVDKGRATGVIYLHFCSFLPLLDTAPHNISKLERWIQWMDCWMEKKLVGWSHLQASGQQLSIPMDTSDRWCPLGAHTGTSVTVIFINDMHEGEECILSKSAGDTKLSSPLDTPEEQGAGQAEKWAQDKLMRL